LAIVEVPPPPPSTKKTLVFPAVELAHPVYRAPVPRELDSSDTGVIELSASALESVRDLEDDDVEVVSTPDLLERLVRGVKKIYVVDQIVSRRESKKSRRDAASPSPSEVALRSLLADSVAPPAPLRSSRRRVRSAPSLVDSPTTDDDRAREPALAARAFAMLPRWVIGAVFARDAGARVAVAMLLLCLVVAPSRPNVAQAREPRGVAPERTELVLARGDAFAMPGAGACAAAPPRMIATSAWLGKGADLSVVDGGFGVGFVAGEGAVDGVRLLGPSLHVGEHVREPHRAWVRRVETTDGEGDALVLRSESDDSRPIATAAGTFRIAAGGGWLLAIPEGTSGEHARVLWALPWTPSSRVGKRPNVAAPESLRVARTADGGAVVALKRPGVVWVGAVGPDLSARGPLVPLARQSTAIGTPALAATHDGGVVAWAEHEAGSADWQIMLASFSATPNEPPRMRAIAFGMSPAIATLGGGDLAVAYATGSAGSHRVVVQRTTPELEPLGDAIVASPDGVNAGQPSLAFAESGRGVVAWFAAQAHGASLSVTPLACGP
jgi:hypothetical protein